MAGDSKRHTMIPQHGQIKSHSVKKPKSVLLRVALEMLRSGDVGQRAVVPLHRFVISSALLRMLPKNLKAS